jgi:hypothetical protein
MTIKTSPLAESSAPGRLDWVAPNVRKLAAGSAEEEGTAATDLGDSYS